MESDNPDVIKHKFPRYIVIRDKVIHFSEAKWYCFYTLVALGLVALLCIVLYIKVYVNSFLIRVDCNPDLPLNYEKCLDRGLHQEMVDDPSDVLGLQLRLYVGAPAYDPRCIWVRRVEDLQPPCFYPDGYGYTYKEVRKTSNGYHVDLERSTQMKMFGEEVDFITLQVYFETENRLRLKFADKAKKRYEVPVEVPVPPAKSPKNMKYSIDFVNDPQFGVLVMRNDTGSIIFDTNIPGMIFSEQYIQLSTRLTSTNIYGFGEHNTVQYKHSENWKKWSFFSRDMTADIDSNLYGVHPFYMNIEEDGNAHGVFLLNSNAMEMIFQPAPALTFRTIGGILDFYIFLGPTPEAVVKQYLEVIGLPVMPPYWALGFHLSRRGFLSLKNVKTVAQRTEEANIPYDVQHFDSDYMNNFRDFTFDGKRFQTLPSYVEELHDKGRKVIIVLHPAIASNKTLESNYPALDVGMNRDIFIKVNGTYIEGRSWAGKSFYPDFSNPEVRPYWTQMCTEFRKSVQFDGLWLDMNEPSSFEDGSLTGCTRNLLNYPPYGVGVAGSVKSGKLFERTLCMDAHQFAGTHYNLHNLYGYLQSNVTYRTLAIIIPGNRPMVFSRSTYPGAGRFVSHSLGENFSSWNQLKASIPGILKFNLFGIPFVGADICGYNGNTTEELCLRWTQLGAFYPLSRNHNSPSSKDQDPVVFGQEFIQLTKNALNTRYELLPYLYTLFHFAHTEGSTVVRALFHEFPKDRTTWTINYQFLWGPSLLISPIVEEGMTSVTAYLPEGIWYDFYKGDAIKNGEGLFLDLMDEGFPNLHVRGGYIIPLQKPNVTATLSRMQDMGLFIAPDENGFAKGFLFWDDGTSYETQEHKTYIFIEFTYQKVAEKAILKSNVTVNSYLEGQKMQFGYMVICNMRHPSTVVLNENNIKPHQWQYDAKSQVLRLNITNPITSKLELVIR